MGGLKMGQRLTDKIVNALPLPPKGKPVVWDAPDSKGRDWVAGFGVRVTAGGARSFIFNYRNAGGVSRRIAIGSPPTWSTQAAREQAREYALAVAKGGDPLADKQAIRNAEAVTQLCDVYLKDHVSGMRNERDARRMVEVIRGALGSRKVAAVNRLDVSRLHRTITERGSPYRANRVLATASSMFGMAVAQGWCPSNPAKGIKRNPEQQRDRCLEPDELARLLAVLDSYAHQDIADRFRLALLTGARIGEISGAKWSEFNADLTRWKKPWGRVKSKKDHTIPINGAARALLQRISSASKTEETVFRPLNPSGVRRHFVAITAKAEIKGLRIHDLRRSFGSTLINLQVPMAEIAKLLGHSKIAITEAHYAFLKHDRLAEASELAGAALSGGKLRVVR
jgi:integrase